MDAETLVKQFAKDPDSVFLDVIRTSPGPIRTQSIKTQVIEAGVKKADVDRRWTPFQRVLKWHPQITSVNGTYRWSADPKSARTCTARKRGSGYATCEYSLISPSRIFLRRTRAEVRSATAGPVSAALGGR